MTRKDIDILNTQGLSKIQLMKKYKEGMVEKESIIGLIVDILLYVILVGVMFICLIPLWHVCISSISDGKVLLGHDGLILWPVGTPTLDGYKYVFSNSEILIGYRNTLLYVVGNAFLGFIMNAIGGYVLSRQTKLKGILSLFILFSLMFSGGTVPLYMVVRKLGLVGTPLAMMIPGCTNAMFLVLVMNSFLQVPESTVEAARIDGAGHIRTLFQVMLPQGMGLAIVTIINTCIMSWNAWFDASIYVPTKREWWPLQLYIKDRVANSTDFMNYTPTDYSRYLVQYCVIVIATLPVLIAFPFFQDKLEKGMVIGGVKE